MHLDLSTCVFKQVKSTSDDGHLQGRGEIDPIFCSLCEYEPPTCLGASGGVELCRGQTESRAATWWGVSHAEADRMHTVRTGDEYVLAVDIKPCSAQL